MTATIHSIYMKNIAKEVVETQAKCVERLLPEGWEFYQHLSETTHPVALEKALKESKTDINIFLDIDCIPLMQRALTFIVDNVVQPQYGENQGLVGAAQRANHIQNDRHLYVGPFCMAFSRRYYEELGSPSFIETQRGDVGEELTYRWTEKSGTLASAGKNPHKYSSDIHFLWPTSSKKPLWELDFGWKFGLGTTYGAAQISPYLFYHAFNARDPNTTEMFLWECNRMLLAHKRLA